MAKVKSANPPSTSQSFRLTALVEASPEPPLAKAILFLAPSTPSVIKDLAGISAVRTGKISHACAARIQRTRRIIVSFIGWVSSWGFSVDLHGRPARHGPHFINPFHPRVRQRKKTLRAGRALTERS